ncbi:MAG: hypothetical protein M1828_006402 [Chrysothrix sp. TS-e1954]|nr:MAG: hypothetical protein M1828_006402 [Chrysothrix sp. TS-e1954]
MATFVDGRAVGFGIGSKPRDKDSPWYKKDLGDIPGPVRELLEKYSGVPPRDVLQHVYTMRDLAWDVDPYPCIGGGTFLQLGASKTLHYREIITRLREGEKLLDVGCCLGQDVRKLVYDGAPSENIYGAELHHGLLNVGYELFRDRSTIRSTFMAADIFNPPVALTQLSGQIDIVWAGSFLHLFEWDDQVKAAKALVSIMRRKKGSLIVGQGMGHLQADTYPTPHSTSKIFKHNEESFDRMWKLVGAETGTSYNTHVVLEVMRVAAFSKSGQWGDPDARSFRFSVTME